MKNSLEIIEERNALIDNMTEIVNAADAEKRSLTEDEQKKFNDLKTQIDAKDEELRQLDIENLKTQISEKTEINIRETKMNKNYSIVKEIREAMANGSNKFMIESRAEGDAQAPVTQNTTNALVEEEYKALLEPLYANSVLHNIGATWYTGLPMGDVVVPIMDSKTNVGWEGELDPAKATNASFTTCTLKPKRLTAYLDISKKLIALDTVGIEAALRRDIVKALNDKFEATVLGAGAGDANTPAGIFNGVSSATVATYANVCDLEAGVEEANATGNMMYLLSPKAKAYFRQLAKSSKHTELVFEGGELDGTSTICTSNVPQKQFVYGNFKDLILAQWDGIEVIVDPYSAAINGCIRLVINAYFDAKIARDEALAFGTV